MNQLQRPNDRKHIAVVYSSFNNDSIQDDAMKELLSLSTDNSFNLSFTYAVYTDQSFIKENLFIPIFHTYYLNSDSKYVILRSKDEYDLPYVYKHHKYCLYGPKDATISDYEELQKKYSGVSFQQIESIKELQ